MGPIVSIQVDQVEVKHFIRDRIAALASEVDAEMVFWDSNELKRRTCMSWETIQSQFFYEPEFPKFKLGGKWYFPAKDTRAFLLAWIRNQEISN